MLRLPLGFILCLLAVGSLVGCGDSGGGDRPATIAATAKVILDGQPVDGALVTLSPAAEGNAAYGTTDATGVVELTTFESGDGAVPGSYKVSITKSAGGAGGGDESGEMSEEEYDAMAESMTAGESDDGDEGASEEAAAGLLPAKYANTDTSELTADVTEAGENNFTFELTE